MIYLTAIGSTPGGSSTHLHTKQYIEQHNQTIHRTTHYRHKQYMEQYNSLEQYSFLHFGIRRGGWLSRRSGRFDSGKETRYPIYRRLDGT
jgi:hypothetical protein